MRHPMLFGISSCAFVLAVGCLTASAEQRSTGMASFYSAVPASSDRLTAAHRDLPFGTRVRVTSIETGKEVVVRINDRGPFVKGRVIDLSLTAAEQLGMIEAGETLVRLEVVDGAVAQETGIAPSKGEACEPNR